MIYGRLDRAVEIFASVASIGDIVLDTFNVITVKKQNKMNMYLTIGTHLALSALAVGVSMYQTNSIKNTIKEYSGKEGGHWG